MPDAECGRCHAPILWAITKAGKLQPLDLAPTPEGTIVLLDEWRESPRGAVQACEVVKAGIEAPRLFGPAPVDDDERYTPHHMTCPHADEYRKPKA